MSMKQFDFSQIDQRQIQRLVYSLVVPRPIAWVSTRSKTGIDNLAPHSFYNAVSSYPPVLSFSSTIIDRKKKDSLQNIEDTGEFVVSLVTTTDLPAILETGRQVAPEVDEFQTAKLDKCESQLVKPPSVLGAPAAFECKSHSIHKIGDAYVVYGEIVHASVKPELLDENGRIIAEAFSPLARMGNRSYADVNNLITPEVK
jgi:flavin reductase (DIM6/NTAB) family NADH-FMN oxidoreductase RutF